MKISDLPCHVQLVFMGSDGVCLSFNDVCRMDVIKNAGSGDQASGFSIGDRLSFAFDVDKIYEIKNISIKPLPGHAGPMRTGVDGKNCPLMPEDSKDGGLQIWMNADCV